MQATKAERFRAAEALRVKGSDRYKVINDLSIRSGISADFLRYALQDKRDKFSMRHYAPDWVIQKINQLWG